MHMVVQLALKAVTAKFGPNDAGLLRSVKSNEKVTDYGKVPAGPHF